MNTKTHSKHISATQAWRKSSTLRGLSDRHIQRGCGVSLPRDTKEDVHQHSPATVLALSPHRGKEP